MAQVHQCLGPGHFWSHLISQKPSLYCEAGRTRQSVHDVITHLERTAFFPCSAIAYQVAFQLSFDFSCTAVHTYSFTPLLFYSTPTKCQELWCLLGTLRKILLSESSQLCWENEKEGQGTKGLIWEEAHISLVCGGFQLLILNNIQ